MSSNVEFEAFLNSYISAFNGGAAQAVANFYTEDAVIMPPMGPAELVGRNAIRAFYTQALGEMQPQLSDYNPQYRISGDLVVVKESWKVTLPTPDGQTSTRRGQGLWAVPGKRRPASGEPSGAWLDS